jgi:hypothetical protein
VRHGDSAESRDSRHPDPEAECVRETLFGPDGKETGMDTTITGIGAAVLAGLRSAGYMEPTVGQYKKTIKGPWRVCETGRGDGLFARVG